VSSVTSARSSLADAPFRISDEPTRSEILAKYFRAFGDVTRLRILELLAEREHSVSELVKILGTTQPQVSNHLACLRWCGFVATRREHRIVYYRLADERISTIVALGNDLLEGNAEHVECCRRIDGPARPARRDAQSAV
jgi:ArsR family transcriptional regulator, cadmium/lead-responsive transcriptional repressor